MSRESFLWHDYETFGTHPGLDRPCQFAAIRTDVALEEVGEPLTWYCKPSMDNLPHPQACLVTGITPQEARDKGEVEAAFAAHIHAEMMEPGTCSAGYNSLRFDDEFTRNLFYRNFYDPYEREYRNGNSRWDLINLARMCYALRPEGIEWPEREPGIPSFRLEHLTAANGIEHSGAHDALADVRATIALARLLRERQPKLFDWGLGMRQQATAMNLLKPLDPAPIIHTSSRYPAARGATSLVLPLAIMPDRPKSVIVVDLMADPEPLLTLAAEDIADRVFTATADLPEDVERIPLKAIHSNKVPMLAPAGVLRGVDTDRIALDPEACKRHAELIQASLAEVRSKVMTVFTRLPREPDDDPDLMIYSGGFFSRSDRAVMNRVLATPPERLGSETWRFEDARLATMLFRYRARNYPDTLDAEEWTVWEADRQQRLREPRVTGQLDLESFGVELDGARREHAGDSEKLQILDQLEAWKLELQREQAGL